MKNEDKQRADRVIEVFNNTGLNQRQFSELIGVSQQLVSAVVNYTKKPNETILLAIIDHIEGIDPLWLFTGKEKTEIKNVPLTQEESPIEIHIKDIVKKEFQTLLKETIQKLSHIENNFKN